VLGVLLGVLFTLNIRTVQGWVSAHVHLGLALLVIATLATTRLRWIRRWAPALTSRSPRPMVGQTTRRARP